MPIGALDFEPAVSPCMCIAAVPLCCSCMPSGGQDHGGAGDDTDGFKCGAIVCLAPDLMQHEPQAQQRHHVYLCVKHRVVHACDERCTKQCKNPPTGTAAEASKMLSPVSSLTFSDWEDDGVDPEEMVL